MTNEVRYCYFVCGHINIDPQPKGPRDKDNHHPGMYTSPFDTVIRLHFPITHDDEIRRMMFYLRPQVQEELSKVMPGHELVDDPLIRQISLLHTILVNSDDEDGVPVKIIS